MGPIGHEAAAMVSIKAVKGPVIVWAHRFGQMSEKQKNILYTEHPFMLSVTLSCTLFYCMYVIIQL
jgi:hypothetical protein